ncbi:MAG: metallophosphoesterase, partial [Proteobacteria bacterium]|nr:metallophosphoesterase [Pseudomonadota bacterium]
MRVVLLSDTHGFVEPYIQNLARSADCVVHAGDVGGLEVIQSLAPDQGKLIVVRG